MKRGVFEWNRCTKLRESNYVPTWGQFLSDVFTDCETEEPVYEVLRRFYDVDEGRHLYAIYRIDDPDCETETYLVDNAHKKFEKVTAGESE